MPRVTEHTSQGRSEKPVRCAKCPEPIVKGQKYYKWAIKSQRGGTVYHQHSSHGRPKQSQLTHSKMSGVYAAIESAEESLGSAGEPSDVAETLRSAALDIESVRDEYQESLDNMPEGLQQGDTGSQIQEKIDGLDEFATVLNDAADECDSVTVPDEEESSEDDAADTALQEALSIAETALGELSI